MDDRGIWRYPELEPSRRQRPRKLDVVEEDRITLVENVVVGQRPIDEAADNSQTAEAQVERARSRRRACGIPATGESIPGMKRRAIALQLASVTENVGKRKWNG